MQKLLGAFAELNHRGCRASRLGSALASALASLDEPAGSARREETASVTSTGAVVAEAEAPQQEDRDVGGDRATGEPTATEEVGTYAIDGRAVIDDASWQAGARGDEGAAGMVPMAALASAEPSAADAELIDTEQYTVTGDRHANKRRKKAVMQAAEGVEAGQGPASGSSGRGQRVSLARAAQAFGFGKQGAASQRLTLDGREAESEAADEVGLANLAALTGDATLAKEIWPKLAEGQRESLRQGLG